MADAGASNTTVIGPGTKIKGDMSFEGSARILGDFEGKITSPGEVLVGESATCRAAIDGAVVIVDGVIEGNVTARRRLQLNPGARITGDVTAASMTVVEGAVLVGMCRIGVEGEGAAAAGGTNGGAEKPRVVVGSGPAKPAAAPVSVNTELESNLAGLESKIAGLGRPR